VISLAGNCLLIVAMISCGVVVVVNLSSRAAGPGIQRLIKLWIPGSEARDDKIFYLGNLSLILSFLLLVFAFVSSDFSLRNVFLNSSTIKPLIYKIAGSWASHEGSILLYLTMLSTISSVYIKISNYSPSTKNLQITILAFVQLLFLCFIYFTSNPFDNFKFVPDQGLGLNPVLQDKALSIHPPLLYIGYVSYIALYANAILLLLRPAETQNILRNSLLFSSFALMALTAGIGLGAWWAYRELGWGGYWFFDPVENISLMPWLVGIALHHFLLVSIKASVVTDVNPERSDGSSSKRLGSEHNVSSPNCDKLQQLELDPSANASGLTLSWTVFTSLLGFLLTIYGIFFVRSGIISSVHSFAFSAERGLYLFGICAILTLVAVIAWVRGKRGHKTSLRAHKMGVAISGGISDALISYRIATSPAAPRNDARITTILIANLLWLLAFGSLFIALIYPIYYSFFYNIDVAIDPEYFQRIFIPIFIPIILLAAIAPVIGKITFKNLIYALISVIAVIIIRHYDKNMGFVSGGIIFVSVFLMSQMLGLAFLERKQITSAKLSLIMGHFSLGMLGFTITMNVLFSEQIEFIGKIGDSAINSSFSVKLNDIKFSDSTVYYRQIAEFSVSDNEGNIVILKPENRLYKIEKTLSQESDIYSYLTHDMFAVLSKVESNNIHAIIYYRPMIFFIWLSVFLMSATFGIYIWGSRDLRHPEERSDEGIS